MESVAYYRTKLMDQARAEQFAKCLAANACFTQVNVVESPRSAGKFFVAYLPTSEDRQAELVQHQIEGRAQRAAQEGCDYVFCKDEARGRTFHYCFNPKSGEVYETTRCSCSCPDFTFRGSKLGIPCKHMLALIGGLGSITTFE